MIIEVLVFFLFIALVVIVGGVISRVVRSRQENPIQAIDNVENEQRLSFPQRYWLPICLVVAVISPAVFHWIRVGVQHKLYNQSVERSTGSSGSGATSAGGDSVPGSMKATDTTYHVATAPRP